MKPIVYEGNEPYIFVSYAHRDSAAVFRVLYELQNRGYRLWYDDGIAPGSEWPEDIAQHLDRAAMVISFITPKSMESQNCRREINYSFACGKPFLSVVLEPTEMSSGMRMQLSAQQSVVRYNHNTWDGFMQKVLSCPGLAPCQAGATAPPAVTQRAPAQEGERTPDFFQNSAKQPKRGTVIAGIAVGALVVVFAIAFALGGSANDEKRDQEDAIIPIERPTQGEGQVQGSRASVYIDRLVPYNSAGFYQTTENLEKNTSSSSVEKAFSLVSFIKSDAEDSVMVELSSCEIEDLTVIEEPVISIEPAIVGNMLYIYGLNNGWGDSTPVDLGITAAPGQNSNYELNDFADKQYDADAMTYSSGQVRLVQSYSLDAEAFKSKASFDERYGDWSILFTPIGVDGRAGTYVIYYSEEKGFAVDISGRGSAPQSSVELFAVFDVDQGPGTLMFSSAESQPLIDGACRIQMTIAPTKTCELTCRGAFSVDGSTCESEPHSVKVNVPVFSPEAFILSVIAPHDNHGSPMCCELAQNPEASASQIEAIVTRYRYNPEWVLEASNHTS